MGVRLVGESAGQRCLRLENPVSVDSLICLRHSSSVSDHVLGVNRTARTEGGAISHIDAFDSRLMDDVADIQTCVGHQCQWLNQALQGVTIFLSLFHIICGVAFSRPIRSRFCLASKNAPVSGREPWGLIRRHQFR